MSRSGCDPGPRANYFKKGSIKKERGEENQAKFQSCSGGVWSRSSSRRVREVTSSDYHLIMDKQKQQLLWTESEQEPEPAELSKNR
uniref:Uncharacterized protein n=1 Tax=Oryza punctata TaxID=4537 RepID=A0A0E0M767_ORYPU